MSATVCVEESVVIGKPAVWAAIADYLFRALLEA